MLSLASFFIALTCTDLEYFVLHVKNLHLPLLRPGSGGLIGLLARGVRLFPPGLRVAVSWVSRGRQVRLPDLVRHAPLTPTLSKFCYQKSYYDY